MRRQTARGLPATACCAPRCSGRRRLPPQPPWPALRLTLSRRRLWRSCRCLSCAAGCCLLWRSLPSLLLSWATLSLWRMRCVVLVPADAGADGGGAWCLALADGGCRMCLLLPHICGPSAPLVTNCGHFSSDPLLLTQAPDHLPHLPPHLPHLPHLPPTCPCRLCARPPRCCCPAARCWPAWPSVTWTARRRQQGCTTCCWPRRARWGRWCM